MLDDLKNKLTNIVEKSRVLLLNEASTIFENNYSLTIPTLTKELISSFDFITNRLIVIKINKSSLDFLNYFLSLCKYPVIILADDIDIDVKYLEQIRTIIKYSNRSTSMLETAINAPSLLKASDNRNNINKFYAEESPEYYYLKNKVSINKYIEVLSYDN